MMNYDRLYDMAFVGDVEISRAPTSEAGDIIMFHNDLRPAMRRPGFEPGCPKAPDPKSPAFSGNVTRESEPGVTDARSATPNDTRSTTIVTTDFPEGRP